MPGSCVNLPIGCPVTCSVKDSYLESLYLSDIVRTADGFLFVSLGCTAMDSPRALWRWKKDDRKQARDCSHHVLVEGWADREYMGSRHFFSADCLADFLAFWGDKKE